MKRFPLLLILSLVLCSVLVSVPRIDRVKASGTIYIRVDGLVDPPTAPIQRDGDRYTFIGGIYDSIVIERSNITIDGARYVIEGDGGPESGNGVSLYNISNATIRNTNIKGFTCGFYLESASNNTISGNNITNNNFDGIRLVNSSKNNNITGNNITNNNFDGIYLGGSSNNTISGNNITNNGYGIRLLDSTEYNTIFGNNITNNSLVSIYLRGSSNNTISGNNITNNNLDGIRLVDSSSNNSMFGNNITNNGWGIRLFYSSSNMLSGNSMKDNEYNFGVGDAIKLSDFANHVDVSNTVDGKPVYYWINQQNKVIPPDAGYVALVNSTFITVKNLNLTKNVQGILLASVTNSTITEDDIANNENGIYLYDSSNNKIYHNNFVDNVVQQHSYRSTNVWDDGYPSGGNFWSDYEERYPDAVEIDESGIWNTPYVIDLDNLDNYPLMPPPSDTTPPTLSILSPENKTYAVNDVPLNFTVSEQTSWIGYSLDVQANVTIGGNTTLYGLSDGSYTLTVYAKDMTGNAGASEMVYFSVNTQQAEPFPILIVVAIVMIAGVGSVLLIYLRRVKKTMGKAKH